MSRELQRRRAERARNGSRRERDRKAELEESAARRIEEQRARRARLLAETKDSPRAADLWEKVLARVKESVPRSTFSLWIEPLRLVGEVNESLHLEAPESIFFWTERRYGRLLGRAARDVGERCKGVYITCIEAPHDRRHLDEDGLL